MGTAAVYVGNSFSNPISQLNVMSVKAVHKARVIAAPVESGQQSFDNKVIDPYDVVVNGKVVIDDSGQYKKVISTLRQMLNSRKFAFYSVSDGENGYKDLILTQCPIQREVQQFDWIDVELRFTQAMMVQAKSSSSSNEENSDCKNIGNVLGVSV